MASLDSTGVIRTGVVVDKDTILASVVRLLFLHKDPKPPAPGFARATDVSLCCPSEWAGATVEDYVRVIKGLTDLEGVTAFEINASCPNTSAGGLEFGATPDSLRDLVRHCRAVATRPIAVKLSPVLPDIAAMAEVAHREGADAITLVNTVPGTLDRRLGNGAGGVSGPALLAIGVLATRKVRAAVPIPVIGVGGIRTAADAREYLAAGASLVAIGTAALADPRVPERVARELVRG